MNSEKSEEIIAHEMPGGKQEMPKDSTYNKYGDDAGKIEIESLGNRGTFF